MPEGGIEALGLSTVNEGMEEAKRAFVEMTRRSREQEHRPVDVASTANDTELDSHLWLRVSYLIDTDEDRLIDRLSDDIRAYYATRFFEWETGSEGPGAIFLWGPELIPMIAPAYRHLGLEHHADVFELVKAIGMNDEHRVAFVRSRPAEFSI